MGICAWGICANGNGCISDQMIYYLKAHDLEECATSISEQSLCIAVESYNV